MINKENLPMTTITNKGIEDVLYEKSLITSDQLSAIKFEHLNTGKSVETIIKERGYVNDQAIAQAIGEVYAIEYFSLDNFSADPKLIDKLTPSTAKKYNVIPLEVDGNNLKLAMADPLDLQVIEFVERKTNLKVVPAISTLKEIERVLDDYKGKAIGEEISAALEEISQTTVKLENSGNIDDEATIRDAPIARIVGMILETAVKIEASDIHLEPGEDEMRLRYRVDGVLEEKRKFPREMQDSIIARIKILSNMKIDEKRIPQDGRFKVQVGESHTDLRVSTLPTIYGEKVVIRLLKEEGSVFTYRDLGLRGIALKRYENATLKPNGIVFVTGPTGSGKTVTQASTLSKLNTIRVNIVSIEDPVEIRVPGVNQVQVNPQAGLNFATGLRAFLRQDPNIIMVGEVRDGETAELAIHAALTGHLVLATLHTNSASGALPRLLDMGVENFLLASTVNAVLAQRLVRKVCQHCKEDYEPPDNMKEEIMEVLGTIQAAEILMNKDKEISKAVQGVQKDKIKLFRGKGCEKCGNTGYKGRLGIFEVLEMNPDIAQMVLDNKPESEIEKSAVSQGMLTLIQDGYLRALEGATSLEEVMRVASS